MTQIWKYQRCNNIKKKNITEIDCATSSSVASITGAVASVWILTLIDEPTPTQKCGWIYFTFITFASYAEYKDVGVPDNNRQPVSRIAPKLSPKS